MTETIGVVGLGYVGLPLAIAFSQKFKVVGFDINGNRISALRGGIDETGEIDLSRHENAKLEFTTDPIAIRKCSFIIVTVPTPVDKSNRPDLGSLVSATRIVAENLSYQTVIVYESTVYPGTTEEVCIPILEDVSKMRAGEDFLVGYSPERINPGDKEHTFKKNIKVVSGQTDKALNRIADVYGSVVEAGIYRAESIKIAEAAKVIENTQRDLNIALMNELSQIFHRMGISTDSVLEAAQTKWNFAKYYPGLVGGHCIGVDPYYLTHKAESLGYLPQVILAGRKINDGMGKFVATTQIKKMILGGTKIQGSVVTVLGLTYKENIRDIRNSKVADIITELLEFEVNVQVCDPYANPLAASKEYGISLIPFEELLPAHSLIIAVPHDFFRQLEWDEITKLLIGYRGVVADIRHVLSQSNQPEGIIRWGL